MIADCIVGGINNYVPSASQPWNVQRVMHLYRRIGFGADYQTVNGALVFSPDVLIDALFDQAALLPPQTPPYWANWTSYDYDANPDVYPYLHKEELAMDFQMRMLDDSLRARMVMFWKNHFVTEFPAYECTSGLWKYYDILFNNCLGNFKDFTLAIGKTHAMLVYLSGAYSVASDPNENYARELFELFTLGLNNGYTENDIVEAARALTGWSCGIYDCTPEYFDPNNFDNGTKTIFGQTGNFDYDTLHDVLFSEREDEIAFYICSKLYKYFIYEDIDENIVTELATTFKANNWELLPVLKQLFKSEHFFDEAVIGSIIKSPMDCYMSYLKSSGMDPATDFEDWWISSVNWWCYQLGMETFSPVNVAGWPGYRDWINETTITKRRNFLNILVFTHGDNARAKMLAVAQGMTGNSSDPVVITQAFIDHFLVRPLSSSNLQAAIDRFKGDVPENYYDNGTWSLSYPGAEWQILNLLDFIMGLPEYQLS